MSRCVGGVGPSAHSLFTCKEVSAVKKKNKKRTHTSITRHLEPLLSSYGATEVRGLSVVVIVVVMVIPYSI